MVKTSSETKSVVQRCRYGNCIEIPDDEQPGRQMEVFFLKSHKANRIFLREVGKEDEYDFTIISD